MSRPASRCRARPVTPASRSAVERRDPAAEEGVRARAVGDGDVACGEERDLGVVDLDAVGAEELRPEHRLERLDRALAGRRDEERGDLLRAGRGRAGATRSRSRSRRGECRPGRRARGRSGRCRASRCRARAARSRSGRAGSRRPARASHATAAPRRPDRRRRPRGRRSRAGRASATAVRGGAGEAVVGDRRDARAQAIRVRRAARPRACPPASSCALPRDVRRDPRAERHPVAEAGVARVLEVRVCALTKPGTIAASVEVALGAAAADLDDAPVLEPDDAVLDRRPVDRQDPVRRDRRAHVPTGTWRARSARRSSSTDGPDRRLVEHEQRNRLDDRRHGVDAGQEDADAADDEVARRGATAAQRARLR